jgi:hypothetical protein
MLIAVAIGMFVVALALDGVEGALMSIAAGLMFWAAI